MLLKYLFKMPISIHIEVAVGSFNPLFVKMNRHLSTSTFIFRKGNLQRPFPPRSSRLVTIQLFCKGIFSGFNGLKKSGWVFLLNKLPRNLYVPGHCFPLFLNKVVPTRELAVQIHREAERFTPAMQRVSRELRW